MPLGTCAPNDAALIAAVDELLLQHGELDMALLLRRLGLLAGDGGDEAQLDCPIEQALALLTTAQAYATAQGLASDQLLLQDATTLAQALSTVMHRRAPAPQLDLFLDSARVYRENALRDALVAHQWQATRTALADPGLSAGTRADFLQLLDHATTTGNTASRLLTLETQTTPLARRLLGPRAASAFLQPLWAGLASDLATTGFDPTQPQLHASYAWARAGDWPAVSASVDATPAAQDHAALLLRLAEACGRAGRIDASRRAWAQLCWRHPACAEDALAQPPADAALAQRWQDFCRLDPPLDVADFPAWLLLAEPRHRGFVPPPAATDHAAAESYALLHRLLVGDGAVQLRRELRALHPDLFAHYLTSLRTDC